MTAEDRIRLHISPFNASLLDAVVPKTIQSVASGISYHATQTDPDKGFGYVELPKAEADKLKKKLHGLVLRGSKMSIEKAKPEKKRSYSAAGPEISERKSKKVKKVKTAKADLTGYELPEGRSVKRGWTGTDKDNKSEKKQKREKSKYNTKDEKEMLFKLGKKGKTSKKSSSLSKDGDTKKRATKDPDVVHEFENNTKTPSFLRDVKAGRSGADLTFVDGQGWVDDEGNVVEAVKVRSRAVPVEHAVEAAVASKVPKVEKKKKQAPEPSVPVEASDDESAEEDSSESEDESPESEDSEDISEEADEDDEEEKVDATSASPERPDKQATTVPDPISSTDQDMDVDVSPEPRTVHPLEALYKRRVEETPKLAPINTSFSFFDVEGNEVEDLGADDTLPQTPFTKQDRQVRGLRSAAPTPDTAAIGRKFSFAFGAAADENEDEDEDDDRRPSDSPLDVKGDSAIPGLTTVDEEPKEQSTFVKEFYERRADMNRSWKQRRREAMKQQRQRENRRLSRRPL